MQNETSCDHHAILVVDDDTAIRLLLGDLFSSEGYRVKIASNGCEALDVLEDGFKPCLILLDLNMPIMDGWQFCAEQQRRTDLPSAPVALMSAKQNLQVAQPPCQPVAVFRKPFDLDRLVHRVHTLVR